MHSTIDFTPLNPLGGQRPGKVAIIGSGMVIVVGISLLWFLGDTGYGSTIEFFIVVGLLTIIGVEYLRLKDQGVQNEGSIRAFAKANHFIFHPGDWVPKKNGPGSLFQVVESARTRWALEGSLGALPFRSYEYYYVIDAGRKSGECKAMVFEISLPRVLPQFVIDSQIAPVIPINFEKSQMIELEGDFHKYFDLYAPDKYSISALTILAPDAMEVLMQHAALCDIEVVRDKLYFYWPLPARTRKDYEQIFVTASQVIGSLNKKLTQDDIYSTEQQAKIHATPGARGTRLKKTKIGFVAVVTGVLFVLAQLSPQFLPLSNAILVLFIFIVIVSSQSVVMGVRMKILRRTYRRHHRR